LTEEWDFNESTFGFGRAAGDTNIYTTGRMGHHNIVLAHMPGMGKATASRVAAMLKMSFTEIRLALVVGVCGGVPFSPEGKEIILGDVVISDGIIEHDFGRRYPNGFERKRSVEDVLARPSSEIRSLIAKLRGEVESSRLQSRMSFNYALALDQSGFEKVGRPDMEQDVLFESTYRHKHQDPAICITCRNCIATSDAVCPNSRNLSCREVGCTEQIIVRQRHLEAQGITSQLLEVTAHAM
jgi:nucleoside phosphorylase